MKVSRSAPWGSSPAHRRHWASSALHHHCSTRGFCHMSVTPRDHRTEAPHLLGSHLLWRPQPQNKSIAEAAGFLVAGTRGSSPGVLGQSQGCHSASCRPRAASTQCPQSLCAEAVSQPGAVASASSALAVSVEAALVIVHVGLIRWDHQPVYTVQFSVNPSPFCSLHNWCEEW